MSNSSFKYNLIKTVKPYSKYISQLSKPVLRVLIKVSVLYIESKNCSTEVLDLALTRLSQSGCEIPENFYELFAAILQILQLYLRMPKGQIKDDELRDCLRDLRFTKECIDDITTVLHNHIDSLSQNYRDVKISRSPMKPIEWCINLTLIESGITRISQPVIVFHIQLKDGQYKTFEVPMVMFHQLRYSIACLLKEFHQIETRSIMKK